jgi:hypothetical protein
MSDIRARCGDARVRERPQRRPDARQRTSLGCVASTLRRWPPALAVAAAAVTIASGLLAQEAIARPARASATLAANGLPDIAAQAGALEQLPGTAGCLAATAAPTRLGCSPIRGRAGGNLAAVISPDGRFLYVGFADGVTTFARDGDGSLRQLDGPSGCISIEAIEGCTTMHGPRGEASALAISPDGHSLYLAGPRVVYVFARTPDTGQLVQLAGADGCLTVRGRGCTPVGRLSGARFLANVAVSADGRSVYVGGERRLIGLARDRRTGALHRIAGPGGCLSSRIAAGCRRLHAPLSITGIATSPDGRFLYLSSAGSCASESETCASGALRVMARSRQTGAVTPLSGPGSCLRDGRYHGCTSAPGAFWPTDVTITPDGRHLYSAGDAIVAATRDPRTGRLTQLPRPHGCVGAGSRCSRLHGLRSPTHAAVSPDGRHLYVGVGFGDSALGVFGRAPATGVLRQLPGGAGCLSGRRRDGCRRVRIAANLYAPVVSPDGRAVYVAGFNMVAAFRRRAQ